MLTNNEYCITVDIKESTRKGLENIAAKANVSVEYLCVMILDITVEDELLDSILFDLEIKGV